MSDAAPRLATILTRHRVTVRFGDCDLLGHVNNAKYLTYIESARIDLWRAQLGFLRSHVIDEHGKRGHGFILARAEVDFRAQSRYGDTLEVRLGLGRFGRSSLTYDYDVVRVGDDTLVAVAKTVQVWFDYDGNRSLPIGDDLKVKLSTPI
jgi:acyl-CoA thioester hydrolase